MTHETVHLATLHGVEVVYLAKLYGHRRVPSPSRVGGRVPAHCTAIGKALAAHDPAAFDALATAPLTALTANSVVDSDRLTLQLMNVRRDGFAVESEEAAPGLACIAVPVFGVGGRPVAGLSVSGPVGSFDLQQHSPALRQVAHSASLAALRAGLGASLRRPRSVA